MPAAGCAALGVSAAVASAEGDANRAGASGTPIDQSRALSQFHRLAAINATATKHCGTRTILVEGELTRIAVTTRGAVKCKVARAISTDYTYATSRGWECSSGGSEGTCTRGSRKVAYHDSGRRPKNCGVVSAHYVDAEGGSGNEIVDVRKLGCSEARSVLRRCIPRRDLPGWAGDKHTMLPLQAIRNGGREIVFRGTAGGAALCAL
jgi:hypothetical protein